MSEDVFLQAPVKFPWQYPASKISRAPILFWNCMGPVKVLSVTNNKCFLQTTVPLGPSCSSKTVQMELSKLRCFWHLLQIPVVPMGGHVCAIQTRSGGSKDMSTWTLAPWARTMHMGRAVP